MAKPIHLGTGRIFPEIQWTEDEKARRKAESEAFYHRCRAIFERVRPELIGEHYGWYIAIEPDSEEYFIDIDQETASQKARQKYPHTIHCLFCLDESWNNMIEGKFNDLGQIYLVMIDEKIFSIPIHAGDDIQEILLGSEWLKEFDLIARYRQEELKLE